MANILHVVNISFVIPYFLGKQLLYFKQKGYQEHIACTYSDELLELSKEYGFKCLSIDVLRKISVLKDIKAVLGIAAYIRKEHIDIVTGHTPKGALIAMIAAYLMRVPIRIYFRHGLVYETTKGLKRVLLVNMDRLAALLATKIVCVSPSVYKRSLKDHLNAESKQIVLSKGTCNGIDIGRFSVQSINEGRLLNLKVALGIKSADFVVGFTGRLVRDKGVVELVQAFQSFKKKHANVVLLLVGMLEERDALPKEIVQEIKETPCIINTGCVSNSSIEYYYALMDVFALPSYREGFPTSVLEASAMNLPVITTRATGCIDAIVENQTGVFVDHTLEGILDAMNLFYEDERLRMQYGCNGRKFVVENFDQHIIWEEIEKLYGLKKVVYAPMAK